MIPKPHFQAVVAVLTCCFFAVLAQSVAAMTPVVAGLTGRWRSTVTSLVHSTKHSRRRLGFCDSFGMFRIKNARPN